MARAGLTFALSIAESFKRISRIGLGVRFPAAGLAALLRPLAMRFQLNPGISGRVQKAAIIVELADFNVVR
jgi:hypothetical protein